MYCVLDAVVGWFYYCQWGVCGEVKQQEIALAKLVIRTKVPLKGARRGRGEVQTLI